MSFFGLKFKLKPHSTTKRKASFTRITNKLVTGYCFKEDGVFKVHVALDGETNLVLEFTPDSYDLRNREVVFDRILNEIWGRGAYVRKEREYKYGPGTTERYISVCENCLFDGYVVKDNVNKKLMFKLNKFIKRGNGQLYDSSQ